MFLQIDRAMADGQAILHQQVLLVEILDEFPEDLARHRNVVVQPGFHGEKLVDVFLVVELVR